MACGKANVHISAFALCFVDHSDNCALCLPPYRMFMLALSYVQVRKRCSECAQINYDDGYEEAAKGMIFVFLFPCCLYLHICVVCGKILPCVR